MWMDIELFFVLGAEWAGAKGILLGTCTQAQCKYNFYPNVTTLRSGLCCRNPSVCLSVCRL